MDTPCDIWNRMEIEHRINFLKRHFPIRSSLFLPQIAEYANHDWNTLPEGNTKTYIENQLKEFTHD